MKLKNGGLFFDLDGTLVNSIGDLWDAFSYAIGDDFPDFNQWDLTKFRPFVSYGARRMIIEMIPQLTDKELDYYHHRFLYYYEEHIAVKTHFYTGLGELLLLLQEKNIKHAIVTNKMTSLSVKLMSQLLPGWQGLIIGNEIEPVKYRPKPFPDRILRAFELTHSTDIESYYFGDYPTDIQAAKNANCQSVALAFGFNHPSNPPSNWQADYLMETPIDLIEFVKQRI